METDMETERSWTLDLRSGDFNYIDSDCAGETESDDKYDMTPEKYKLFMKGLCPVCKGQMEEDWSAGQICEGYEHRIWVGKCKECGLRFADYESDDPDIIDCVEYYDY